jgi:hypothetical protein
MPEGASAKNQARFVFQGTVQQLNAVTMRSIAASANTMIVKGDHVIRGPDVANDFVGSKSRCTPTAVRRSPDREPACSTRM